MTSPFIPTLALVAALVIAAAGLIPVSVQAQSSPCNPSVQTCL